jgi:hypothetical protein
MIVPQVGPFHTFHAPLYAKWSKLLFTKRRSKILIGTLEQEFDTLVVLFIEWIPGSPICLDGYLEIRFSRMDSWN